jgi:hypothetical protein
LLLLLLLIEMILLTDLLKMLSKSTLLRRLILVDYEQFDSLYVI